MVLCCVVVQFCVVIVNVTELTFRLYHFYLNIFSAHRGKVVGVASDNINKFVISVGHDTQVKVYT